MAPVFFADWPLLLLPIHVVFLELIIDPACSIIFEAENAEPNTMNRPPRNPTERLFNLRSVGFSILQGTSDLAVLLAVFWLAGRLGHPDDDSRRALVFATLVVVQYLPDPLEPVQIANDRFDAQGTQCCGLVGRWRSRCHAGSPCSMCRSYASLFHFGPLHGSDIVLCVAAGAVSITWFELLKVLRIKLA